MAGIPTGGTVTVACKIPAGIWMRVFEKDEYDMPVLGGGTRKESRALPKGEPIKINGPAVPFGKVPPFMIKGGYALTPNVPADIAQEFMRQNANSDMVKNNLIFIHEKHEYAEKRAKELKAVKSGLEPLDIGTMRKDGREMPRDVRWPARIPGPHGTNLSTVATDVRE